MPRSFAGRRRLWVAAALLPLGCHSERATLAPVRGTVTHEGRPVAKGTITFESPKHRPSIGRIRDGQIVGVSTYAPDDGVPVGTVSVAVTAVGEAASAVTANPGEAPKARANYMGGPSLLPAKYADPATSGLNAEIKPGENVVEFRLKGRP